MFSWLLGLMWRGVRFWGVFFFVSTATLLMFIAALEGQSGREMKDVWELLGVVGRFGCFVAGWWLLYRERQRLDEHLVALERRIERVSRAVPKRLGRLSTGCLPRLIAFPCWCVLTCVAVLLRHGVPDEGGALLVLVLGQALFFTLAWAAWGGVMLDGLSVWRHRLRARGVPPEEGEHRPGPVFPWIVGLSGGLALLVSFLGMPDPVFWSDVTLKALGPQRQGDLVELVLELEPGGDGQGVARTLKAFGATATRAFPEVDASESPALSRTVLVTAPMDQAVPLLLALGVLHADQVAEVAINEVVAVGWDYVELEEGAVEGLEELPVNDPYASRQSALVQLGAGDALTALDRLGAPYRPRTIAILDTGVSGSLPDLRGVMASQEWATDSHGHGTAAAAAAGAITHNGVGVASLNLRGDWLRLRSYPVLPDGRGDEYAVAKGISDAVEHGVDVISLSLGALGEAPKVVVDAVDYAAREDILVVVAAGNDGALGFDAAMQWPANIDGVLVVGSHDGAGRKLSFSNTTFGVDHEVSAPGASLLLPLPDGGHGQFAGTSFSAPRVAGLAGVLRGICPDASSEEIIALLEQTGDPSSGGIGPAVRADRAIATARSRGCRF